MKVGSRICLCLLIVFFARQADCLELIRRNLSWTLEADNDPIVQITNEGEVGRILTLRILLGESSYRYRSDFEVPTGENRFVRLREILQQLTQRYPEIKDTKTGLLQIEYDGLDREIKTRIVNLSPRSGVVSENTGEAPSSPSIRSLQPSAGNPAGGTVVTIVGDNFTEATSVKFGGVPAMRSLQSRETLVAVAPPHSAGAVDVEVTNGRRSAKLERAFHYETEGPVIFKLEPEEGPSRGGVRVLIRGRNFQQGIVAKWDGRMTEVRYQGSDLLSIVAPPGRSGPVALEVINPDSKNYLFPDAFKYKGVPDIVSVSPSMGSLKGAYTVTVNGSDFESGASVLFNGRYVQTTFISPQALAAVVPEGEPGPVDVSVTNPAGEVATLSQGFLYNDPPSIRDITVDPALIVRNTTARIVVDAYDPEIGPLEYSYRVASGSGTVIPEGNEATFNSVNVSGRMIVEVTVYDQYRSKTIGIVEIEVQ